MQNFPINVFSVVMGKRPAFKKDNRILPHPRNIDTLPTAELSIHAHPYHSLTFLFDCDDYFTYINGYKLQIRKHHLYYYPPNTLHPATNHISGSRSGITLKFRVRDETFSEKLGNIPFFVFCNEEIQFLVREFCQYAEKEPSDKSILNAQAVGLIDRIFSKCDIKYIERNDFTESDDTFIPLIKYMYDHINEDFTLSKLAEKVYLHPTYFSRKFKAIYNITPMNYLFSAKLFRSLDELAFTNKSISAIAESIGFEHTSSFCSAFRRAYGLSPGEYRELSGKMNKFEVVTDN